MQDKEFDGLFTSKFDGFEIEPSPMVWQNIAAELDGKKAKRAIVPYLSIAASVIVLLSVSIWFFNRSTEKPDQHLVKILKGIKTGKQQPVIKDNGSIEPVEKIENEGGLKLAAVKTGSDKRTDQTVIAQAAGQPQQQETPILTPEPINQKPEPLLAVLPAEKPITLQAAVPGNDVPLTTGSLAEQSAAPDNKPQEALAATEPGKVQVKKRAHGLGGFINTIVAAVDKREDKLIEFTDNDGDDGSRVTAVNLGIFKIKKQ